MGWTKGLLTGRKLVRSGTWLVAANKQGQYWSPHCSEYSLETIQDIKHVLDKSGDNPKLGKVIHVLNSRASVQRNLDKLED